MNCKLHFIIILVIIALLTACDDPEDKADRTSPNVTIISPNSGSMIEGEIAIQAVAVDNKSVEKVEFWIDSTLVNTDFESPWEYTGNTEAFADGNQHCIVAKAYDPSCNVGLSEVVLVTILIPGESGFVMDIDGNRYGTIKIGDQTWMTENLKVTHYRDGSAITLETDNAEWVALTTEAYCIYYNYISFEGDDYGALYNWYALTDSRNIAPEGWHVPTDTDWKELEMALGMSQSSADADGSRGTNEGSKLAGNSVLWNSGALENDTEFDSSGFTALPGGYRHYFNGNFYNRGYFGYFWSSSESASFYAWYRRLNYDNSDVTRSTNYKQAGYAVRLLKD